MTRPSKVCAQDFILAGLFFPEGRSTCICWLVARPALPGLDLCVSPSLTDCIGRVRRTSFRVNFMIIFKGNMRYEKAARSPRFFNNERYPSQSSCGLLWSARVRYGSVSRSGLRRPCARAAAPYRHTRMCLSAACALSACRPARSQMHAKGYRHLRLDCMHPHPQELKSFLSGGSPSRWSRVDK